MKVPRIAILLALLGACSEPTPPPGQVPPLEAVSYTLLGSGKIAFERIAPLYHAVYLVDPVAQTSTVVASGVFNGPALSPDGQQLAVTAYTDPNSSLDVYAHRMDGSGRRRIGTYPGDDGVPSWTVDGNGLTFLRSHESGPEKVITEARASDGVAQRTITLRRADACSQLFVGDSEDRVEVASNGLIATPCGLNQLVILSGDGVRVGVYSAALGSLIIGFAWSPDGSKLAVMEMAAGSAGLPVSQTLRIVPANGGSPRQVFTMALELTQNGRYAGANDSAICWLKGVDRLLVAILHEARRYSQLWVVNEDGTGLTRVTTAPQVTDRSVSCSR